jgi:hypothetical protein
MDNDVERPSMERPSTVDIAPVREFPRLLSVFPVREFNSDAAAAGALMLKVCSGEGKRVG